MPKVKSVKQLTKILQESANAGIRVIGEQAVIIAQRQIAKWYTFYEPKQYDRQGDLADYIKSDSYGITNNRVRIYYDTKAIGHGETGVSEENQGGWQLRVNRFSGSDSGYQRGRVFSAYKFFQYVETGKGGGRSPRPDKGAKAMKAAEDWIRKKAIVELAKQFKGHVRINNKTLK